MEILRGDFGMGIAFAVLLFLPVWIRMTQGLLVLTRRFFRWLLQFI